jgi:hypothetical protein
MDFRQISKWMVIAGALLIWAIKFIIRPGFHFEEPMRFFLGIAPNLFGSFLIPFAAVWFFGTRYFLIARLFHIRNVHDLRYVCLGGLALLIVNEYLQLIPLFGRTFDYWDILFSAAGLIISYFVCRKIYGRLIPDFAG